MNREQYIGMLHRINEVRVGGGDIAACIAEYRKRYKYVYVYNDSCFKKIFGAPSNKGIAASFLNAVLKLEGANCVRTLDFVDPSVPGGPFVKSVTSDLVALNQDKNRIVIEVQHKGDSEFKDRLVFYTACHTLQNKVPGEIYKLRKMDFIALQMFDAYSDSSDYRHCVQLKNQNNELFFGKHTLTIVEVRKFIEGDYKEDDSRLAHWLRAIECVNNECDEGPEDNPYWKNLQNAAKLCNFDMEYLLAEAKYMTDIAYEMNIERKEARAEGLAEGLSEGRSEGALAAKREMARNMLVEKFPVSQVVKITGLSESEILDL